MAGNQETNSFIEAMKTKKPEASLEEKIEEMSKYSVNPGAERVANTVAQVVLWLFNIFGIITVIAGIAMAEEGGYMEATGITSIIAGVILLIIGIIVWAGLKMFVNMSRNLYNINDVLHEIKNK